MNFKKRLIGGRRVCLPEILTFSRITGIVFICIDTFFLYFLCCIFQVYYYSIYQEIQIQSHLINLILSPKLHPQEMQNVHKTVNQTVLVLAWCANCNRGRTFYSLTINIITLNVWFAGSSVRFLPNIPHYYHQVKQAGQTNIPFLTTGLMFDCPRPSLFCYTDSPLLSLSFIRLWLNPEYLPLMGSQLKNLLFPPMLGR